MKILWTMVGWIIYLFLFLLLGSRLMPHIAPSVRSAWEWVESKIAVATTTPEERLLKTLYPDLTEIRKKAEAGDAEALFQMGWAYKDGVSDLPQSDSIAVQYYLKAYEKAVEQGNLPIRKNAASSLSSLYFRERNDGEHEKWRQRAREAQTEIEELEKAAQQKLIEEHEAMIPQLNPHLGGCAAKKQIPISDGRDYPTRRQMQWLVSTLRHSEGRSSREGHAKERR